MKKFNAVELFTKVLSRKELDEAYEIYQTVPTHQRNAGLAKIIKPVMAKIDEEVGQPNDLNYMAYLLEHIFNRVGAL